MLKICTEKEKCKDKLCPHKHDHEGVISCNVTCEFTDKICESIRKLKIQKLNSKNGIQS